MLWHNLQLGLIVLVLEPSTLTYEPVDGKSFLLFVSPQVLHFLKSSIHCFFLYFVFCNMESVGRTWEPSILTGLFPAVLSSQPNLTIRFNTYFAIYQNSFDR